jgi:hypothetical protein
MFFKTDKYHYQVAFGWVMVMLTHLVTLVFATLRSIFMDDNFSIIRDDPGTYGLYLLVYVVALYLLMPVLTFMISSLKLAAGRWLMVIFSLASLFFTVLHHLSHWVRGDRSDFNSHVFDLTIHTIGIWLVYSSVRWALSYKAESAVKPAV